MAMDQSILDSTKKILNVDPSDTSFDLDILTHINTSFSHLHQLGIGSDDGFVVDDKESKWEDFLPGAPLYIVSAVKTNVYLRVRSLFDPPTLSHVLTAMQQQLEESDVRLSTMRESTDWVHPNPPTEPVVVADPTTLEGRELLGVTSNDPTPLGGEWAFGQFDAIDGEWENHYGQFLDAPDITDGPIDGVTVKAPCVLTAQYSVYAENLDSDLDVQLIWEGAGNEVAAFRLIGGRAYAGDNRSVLVTPPPEATFPIKLQMRLRPVDGVSAASVWPWMTVVVMS